MTDRFAVPGTVYLLHFDTPYKHARHYLGWTEGPLDMRLQDHKKGRGARLLAVITQAGTERRLKKRKEGTRLCPMCKGASHA